MDMKQKLGVARNWVADKSLGLSVAGMSLVPVLARAEGADPFDAAITDITAKVTAYGGALVGVAAVAVAFFVAIKYVKKISRAA